MISPKCDRCHKELTEPGALAFSPPDEGSTVVKYHLCTACWPIVREVIWDGPSS